MYGKIDNKGSIAMVTAILANDVGPIGDQSAQATSFNEMTIEDLESIVDALTMVSDTLLGVMNRPRVDSADGAHGYLDQLWHENVKRIHSLFACLEQAQPVTAGDWKALELLVMKYHAHMDSSADELLRDLKRIVADRRNVGLAPFRGQGSRISTLHAASELGVPQAAPLT